MSCIWSYLKLILEDKVWIWKVNQEPRAKAPVMPVNVTVVYYPVPSVIAGNRNVIENSRVTTAANEECLRNAGTKFPCKFTNLLFNRSLIMWNIKDEPIDHNLTEGVLLAMLVWGESSRAVKSFSLQNLLRICKIQCLASVPYHNHTSTLPISLLQS